MIKVIIVEDNDTIREGLSALINGTENYKCVGSFPDCEGFLRNFAALQSDVILMDLGLPGMSGIEGIKKAKQIDSNANILVLTIYEDNNMIFDALCAGACGYLVKKTPPAKLLDAIKEAHEGGSPMSSNIAKKVITVFTQSFNKPETTPGEDLTLREKEVLSGLAEGNNYQEIANALFISIDTVRHHIRNIYRKLQVHSQSEAVAKALKKGIIEF